MNYGMRLYDDDLGAPTVYGSVLTCGYWSVLRLPSASVYWCALVYWYAYCSVSPYSLQSA